MGFQDFYSSDYGSGRSSTSGSPWGSWDKWDASAGVRGAPSFPPAGGAAPRAAVGLGRAASFGDVGSVRQRGNIEEVMLEFQLNGSDSPYDPEEEQLRNSGSGQLSGMGPAAAYLRQKSWPAPDRSPAVPLPLERSPAVPMIHNRPDTCTDLSSASSSPLNSQLSIAASGSPPQSDVITAEQMRVLQQLPDEVLQALLRDLQAQRDAHSGYRTPWRRLPEECRFCKNNGERELFYRSHVLKDAMGRVSCPVLRAFTCKRCGAKGDSAHTIKYCPLSTSEERIHSVAMMRSVQLQSRRRRMRVSPTSVHSQVDELTYTFNGSAPSSAPRLNYMEEPLDPLWAALERQLLL